MQWESSIDGYRRHALNLACEEVACISRNDCSATKFANVYQQTNQINLHSRNSRSGTPDGAAEKPSLLRESRASRDLHHSVMSYPECSSSGRETVHSVHDDSVLYVSRRSDDV